MRRSSGVVAIAIALSLTGCAGGAGTADKAGGFDTSVTLRMGTIDGAGYPGAEVIAQFGRHLEALSEGQITIEPVYLAYGAATHQFDQQVARRVESRELDMGLIAASAWDSEGVVSLRALHAPFLVTSEVLLRQIVTGELAGQTLEGLDQAGVVGLALLPAPSGNRHPFGFEHALLSPEDYAGKTIRAPRSDVVFAALQELGATPEDLNPAEFRVAAADGLVAGAESSFDLAEGFPMPSIATGNVTLYAKSDSLVINQQVFEELSGDQQGLLRAAAARTRDWAVANTTRDSEAARHFCETGGRVVLASAADLDALEDAVRPVYEELERDPTTRALIAQIRVLKGQLKAAETVKPCGDR